MATPSNSEKKRKLVHSDCPPAKKQRQRYIWEFLERGSGEPFKLGVIVWQLLRFCGTMQCKDLRLVSKTFRDTIHAMFDTSDTMDMPQCSPETMGRIPSSLLWRWFDSYAGPRRRHRDTIDVEDASRLTRPIDRCMMYLQYAHDWGGTARVPPWDHRWISSTRCDACLCNKAQTCITYEFLGKTVEIEICGSCLRRRMLDCADCQDGGGVVSPLSITHQSKKLIKCLRNSVGCAGVMCEAHSHVCAQCHQTVCGGCCDKFCHDRNFHFCQRCMDFDTPEESEQGSDMEEEI